MCVESGNHAALSVPFDCDRPKVKTNIPKMERTLVLNPKNSNESNGVVRIESIDFTELRDEKEGLVHGRYAPLVL